MKNRHFFSFMCLICMMVLNLQSISQTQTMGVFINDTSKVFKGYTLFAPKQNTMTYLIDNQGRKVHEWSASTYAPGQAVYLLDNGHLLRTCMTQGNLGTGGGEGGRIEEYDWDDHLVWSLDYSTTMYMQHHDIKKLPNGNIIMLVVEKKTMAQVEAAGFDTSTFQPDARQKGFILPDCIIEIQPTYPTGGTKVWEWHVWDHLIQNHDATKLNYGTPSLHPELIDCAGDHRVKPLFWNHMNAIDYNPALDQIVMSVRGNSELWVIDHNTSTAQATGHSGGAHGKGGDLLYRWGNPQCYGIGTQSNEKYFEQHDVEWIKSNCPGAGNLLCFNNGVNRNYSSIDEIIPPIDLSGNYTYTTGTSFGPLSNCWTYNFTSPDTVYAHDISGAQRLPNGNTIACAGPFGALYEITATGQIVWKYISPVTDKGPLNQGMAIPHNPIRPEETMNSIFRVYKYPPTYAGFTGHNLVAGNVLELLPLGMNTVLLNDANDLQVYPNPFSSVLNVLNAKSCVTYTITNSMGQVIWSGDHIETQDFSWLKAGMYFLNVNETVNSRVIKLLKQ